MSTFEVALVQATPALFDKTACIGLVLQYLEEARDADLIVFPESFIPGYPRGMDFGTLIGHRSEQGRKQFTEYSNASVRVSSEDLRAIQEKIKAIDAYVCLGVTERAEDHHSLYCSLIYFDRTGTIIDVHRKIKPTAAERIIWGEGDGRSLSVHKTSLGKLGGLICWENYMPLARMALYRQGIEIYVAPTADQRDGWQSTLRHIAIEGRCYVLGVNQYVSRESYSEKVIQQYEIDPTNMTCRGGTVAYDPMGKLIAGPMWDQTGILRFQIDRNKVTEGKFDLDVGGHYDRPDLFEFRVKSC